jgi:hypothetical protein
MARLATTRVGDAMADPTDPTHHRYLTVTLDQQVALTGERLSPYPLQGLVQKRD